MNTPAEFTIIGRVGEIKQVGTTLRVSIASSYSRKDNRGEWIERTRWNEVTIFSDTTRGYVRRNIGKGDLVFTSGSLGQTQWEKDGETFYGVTLAAERIERLCKGPNHRGDKGDEPQEAQRSGGRRFGYPVLTQPRGGFGLPDLGDLSEAPCFPPPLLVPLPSFPPLRDPKCSTSRNSDSRAAPTLRSDAWRRLAEQVALDRASRRSESGARIALTLTQDAELRWTLADTGVIHLHGRDGRGRPVPAVWRAPEDFDRDRVRALFRRLASGALVELEGLWRTRDVRGTPLIDFVAQYLTLDADPPVP